MSHGVDLKGDLGRFQIIMKVPYLPLSNKRIKRLCKEDYSWYVYRALSSLVQMAGRCICNETYKAITYIVDGSAVGYLNEAGINYLNILGIELRMGNNIIIIT